MYVIVYCGYEGIDRVLWAGEEGAREVCLSVRKHIVDNLESIGRYPSAADIDYKGGEDYFVVVEKWQEKSARARDVIGEFWCRMDNPKMTLYKANWEIV